MSDVILHHFALSPFAEKVRIGLGLKQAAWKSVDIPIIMPKPDLMPLTGGYRKTPVMQVGADIYCDTQLIMLELERRLPSPPFLLKGREGEARAITMWIDRNMFAPAVGLVMSQIDVAGKFGAGFARDRSDFSGRNCDPERLRAVLPVVRDQAYGQLSLAEAMLADGRRFVLGAEPSMPDCALYNPVWFIQQHLGVAASPLDRLPRIVAWSERMKALGNGKRKDITATEALEIAKSAKPAATSVDTGDPSGLKAGRQISITPDDTGKVPVSGELVGLSADSISIARNDPRVGEVVVHFPRAGFIIHRYSRLENDTRSQRDRGADDYGTQKQMQIDEDRCGSDPVVGASFQKLPGRVSLPSGTRPGSPSSADLWSVPEADYSLCVGQAWQKLQFRQF